MEIFGGEGPNANNPLFLPIPSSLLYLLVREMSLHPNGWIYAGYMYVIHTAHTVCEKLNCSHLLINICSSSGSVFSNLMVSGAVLYCSDADALMSADRSTGLAAPSIRMAPSMVPSSCPPSPITTASLKKV